MADEILKRDSNRVTVLGGITDNASEEIRNLIVDSTTGRLKVQATFSPDTFDDIAPTTTKGDLIVHNGTTNVRQAVGTDGQTLVADSAQSTGIKWGNVTAGAAGSDTQVQFNDGGTALGADAGFTYNKTTDTATLVGAIQAATANLADTAGGQYLKLTAGSNLSADRAFTITTGDAARTLSMAGNLTIAADFITSGANSLTLTTSGATNVTLPTTGTLATLAGSEALTNKTVNGLTITSTNGTLTLANGSSLVTSGANSITLTSSGATNVTLPTTGTLATLAGAESLSNKTLVSPIITTSPTAAGSTWTDLGTVTTADINGGTVDGTVIGGASAAAITGTTITANTGFLPDANDGAYLGQSGTAFSDLFLASGALVDFAAGNVVLTHSSGILTVSTGELRITTVGTNSASVPTLGSTSTLTNKTLTAPVINASTLSGIHQLAEGGVIQLDAASSADGAYCGITRAGTAGATLAFGDLVYLAAADSRWELADADAASTSGDVMLGMCVLAAAADGDPTTILFYGIIRADAAFPSLTISAPAYVSTTAGDIQVAQPSGTDDVIRRVGFAWTADELFFNPSTDYITHT